MAIAESVPLNPHNPKYNYFWSTPRPIAVRVLKTLPNKAKKLDIGEQKLIPNNIKTPLATLL